MRRLFKNLWLLCIVGILVLGERAEAKSLMDATVRVLQSYVAWEDGDSTKPVPRVMLVDGETLLEEGVDYQIELRQDVFDESMEESDMEYKTYVISIVGLGDYADGNTLEVEVENEGLERIVGDWFVLEYPNTDNSESEYYILSYLGSDKEVTVPIDFTGAQYYDSIVYDIFEGAFSQNEAIEVVHLGEYPVGYSYFLDCPNLKRITSTYTSTVDLPEEADELYPTVLGVTNNTVQLTVPFGFFWMMYDAASDSYSIQYTIEEYCEAYGYQYLDQSDVYQYEDWLLQISEEEMRAEIVSYTGEEEIVTIPESVSYNGDDYDIEVIRTGAFDGLDTLREINLGKIYPVAALCKDCPNLEKITTTNADFTLNGPIVTGDAPEDNTLVISCYANVEWDVDPDENIAGTEDDIFTIQEYCEYYKYVFERVDSVYSDFEIWDECREDALAGATRDLIVTVCMDEEEYELSELDVDYELSDWQCVGENAEYATIDQSGRITYSSAISETTTILLQCTVTIEEERFKVLSSVAIQPKLVATKNQVLQLGSEAGIVLNCDMRYYDESGCLETKAIPEDTQVTYIVADESVVTVSDTGVLTAAEGAEPGESTQVRAEYLIEDKTYHFTYVVTIEETKDTTGIGSELIYVYGWTESGFDRQIEGFLASYPDLRDQIQYIEIDIYDHEEDDDWLYYKKQIDAAMGGTKAPDVVLWPAAILQQSMQSEYIVPLSDVGFDATWYDSAFAYTKLKGTYNDRLYAVTYSVNPGCFVYRKDIARKVFGTDVPADVQQYVKDWDTMIESAAMLREQEYYMLSGLDLKYPVFNGSGQSWITEGTINLDGMVSDYLSLERKLYLSECVSSDIDSWDYYDAWIEYKEDCFGFFADAQFISMELKTGGYAEGYAVCQGPVYHETAGSNYLTATNVNHNNQLVTLLLKELVSNEAVMSRNMDNTLEIMNHESALESYAATDEKVSVWYDIAKNIPVVPDGIYDVVLEELLYYEFGFASYYYEMSKGKIENTALKSVLSKIATTVSFVVDSVEVTYSPDTSWKEKFDDNTGGSEENPDVSGDAGSEENPDVSGDAGSEENPDVSGDAGSEENPDVSGDAGSEENPDVSGDAGNEDDSDVSGDAGATGGSDGSGNNGSGVNGDNTGATGGTDKDNNTGNNNTGDTSGNKNPDGSTGTEYPPVHTHTYGAWTIVTEAMCNQAGNQQRVCSSCQHVETRAIPATGYVKGGIFVKSGQLYKIASVKKKKGNVIWLGPVKSNKNKITIAKTAKSGGYKFTVTEIGAGACKDNTKLKTVTISSNITKIGKQAFAGCKNLKTIKVKTSKLKSVGKQAFKGINKKAKIDVPEKNLKKYKKLMKNKGQAKTVTIK